MSRKIQWFTLSFGFALLIMTPLDPIWAANPVDQLVAPFNAQVKLSHSPKFEGRGDGVETCPVTGDKIMGKDWQAELHGRTVYFCCKGCMQRAVQLPDKYVKPTLTEQKQAVQQYLASNKSAGREFDPEMCDE